jgi:hypothetical protein
VYATDFVLLSGTGAVAAAGPPLVVLDESTALTSTGSPLAQLRFVGAGVTATLAATGQVTVTVPGGSGGITLQSGSATANVIPKFFNTSTTPTVANSSLSDSGVLVSVANPLAPSANNTHTLGTSGSRWSTTFTQTVNAVTVTEALVTGNVSSFVSGGTLTLNYASGTTYWLTRDTNFSSLSITNMPAGACGSMTVILQANGTAFSAGWGSVKWANNVTPTLTSVNLRYDLLSFFMANNTIFGFVAGLGHV